MKNKLFIISGLGFISSLLLGSCASRQLGGFQDDLYQSTAKAVERPYLSPDYYYDSVGDARAEGSDYDGDYETYVDDEDSGYYTEEGFYADEYEDSEYAKRFNRFYYASPGMTYFDPYYDPFYMGHFSPYYLYDPWFYGNTWRMGWGIGAHWSMGWGGFYYDPFRYASWGGYPYYRSNYWGPYSYYGGWGSWGGYYGGGGSVTRPRSMNVRSSSRDDINVRGERAPVRSSGTQISRTPNGRITTTERGNAVGSRTQGTRPTQVGTRTQTGQGSVRSTTRPGGTREGVRPTGTTQRPQSGTTGSGQSTTRPVTRPSNSNSGQRSTPAPRQTTRPQPTQPTRSGGASVAPPARSTESSRSNTSSGSSSSRSSNSSGSSTRSGSRGN